MSMTSSPDDLGLPFIHPRHDRIDSYELMYLIDNLTIVIEDLPDPLTKEVSDQLELVQQTLKVLLEHQPTKVYYIMKNLKNKGVKALISLNCDDLI